MKSFIAHPHLVYMQNITFTLLFCSDFMENIPRGITVPQNQTILWFMDQEWVPRWRLRNSMLWSVLKWCSCLRIIMRSYIFILFSCFYSHILWHLLCQPFCLLYVLCVYTHVDSPSVFRVCVPSILSAFSPGRSSYISYVCVSVDFSLCVQGKSVKLSSKIYVYLYVHLSILCKPRNTEICYSHWTRQYLRAGGILAFFVGNFLQLEYLSNKGIDSARPCQEISEKNHATFHFHV